jgi:hypothetical protein
MAIPLVASFNILFKGISITTLSKFGCNANLMEHIAGAIIDSYFEEKCIH